MNVARGYTTGDTIVARATPRGASALSIVRLSGAQAVTISASVFEGKDLSGVPSHTASVGYLRSDDEGAVDHVVATVFLSPNTATGEDIVEFTCHGGDVASDEALRMLVQAGARMAGPGEFTFRAFLNGKIDLAQAEAIGDLIHAKSVRSNRVSIAHLRGEYSSELSIIRASLLELLALIELELDFSEEDVEFADKARLEALLNQALLKIGALASSFRLGNALAKGVRVVIAGRPNAGKSTLMNAILGYDRVIVSEVPGTTRDEIEASIIYNGIAYQFVDTAGMRETADLIEAEGVKRSEKALSTADVLLYLIDITSEGALGDLSWARGLPDRIPGLAVLVVGNKVDMAAATSHTEYDLKLSAKLLGQNESDLGDLMGLIERISIGSDVFAEEQQIVTSQRHQVHLEAAKEAALRAQSQLHSGGSGDMLSADVRSIVEHIGSITGEVTNEDVLSQIFSCFCIGK
ncbi:tRNA uridine-5-carboxymethylaminomethyl(34) synthesis GTPase MnmE [bacterium]|nr:tRNA uridine-5-carboxymethylaminomethyl(34) synthesis GTPase MnmE [bacterium]